MRVVWLYILLWLSTIAAAADIKVARKAAADRPRPLIFNNDGCDVVYEMKQPTAEDQRGSQRQRTRGLQRPPHGHLRQRKDKGHDEFHHSYRVCQPTLPKGTGP